MQPQKKIKAKVVFELIGNPKEHVVGALKKYLEFLKGDPEMSCSEEYLAEPEEQEGLWSTFAEITVDVASLDKLIWLCTNFTPASVEILEPDEFKMTDKNVTDLLNDLLSRLHEVTVMTKNATSENELLKVNINRLIRNSALIALKYVPRGLRPEELARELGVEQEDALIPFFDAMEKEGRIKKTNGVYQLP